MPTQRSDAQADTRALPKGDKWSKRASIDPFAGSNEPVKPAQSAREPVNKENKAPPHSSSSRRGIVMTPTMVRRRSSAGSAINVVNVITKQSSKLPARANTSTLMTANMLGKRPRGPSPTRSPVTNKMPRRSEYDDHDEEEEEEEDDANTQRTLFASESDAVHDENTGTPRNMLVVNEFGRAAELAFGAVAVGQRKSLLLTMVNPSQAGNARVKYEGYVMATATREPLPKQTLDARFKCDLHVCTVPAEGRVALRITFEPKEQDANQELVGTLRFTVNDRFRLQCEVSGSGVPAAAKPLSLRQRMSLGQATHLTGRKSLDSSSLLGAQRTDAEAAAEAAVSYPIERVVLMSGTKRRESVALVVSPPRHRKTKKMRVDQDETIKDAGAIATGGFHGSWWEKRKTLSNEEWMQRQEEGFTKWINFVLVDSMGENDDHEELPSAIIEHPHRRSSVSKTTTTAARGRKRVRTRIDFSSLRVLAMKRMESMWSRAAMELYRSDEITEAAGSLKNEIAEGKLVVRRDRPAYADVGLQEELIELLNNYHPVWLCLALETVLGHRTMADERCTLRSVMSYCANLAEKSAAAATGKKHGEPAKAVAATRMPRQLRRVVLQHLVHDHQVANRYRLVKNLKTPVEGHNGTLRTGRANPKISGREYFDVLMDSFVFKFLMVVLLLDRAAAQRSDKFSRFPCLFRVQPEKTKNEKQQLADDDARHVKHSQGIVAEFCRLFLSREGRIDKHLKQLGYSVSFQQVPLDEVDLEITNLAVDLRDGVRLAKLLETLTVAPTAAPAKAAAAATTRQPLSSFLRVPALSRLQKIHNLEICLHFLQEKCGRDFLESVRSSGGARGKSSGRLSFATLRDKEDAKLVETMAKAVVDGHRERTLALLWKLISVFQLRSLVNVDKLTKEIEQIKQRMSFRSMEFYEACCSGAARPAAITVQATGRSDESPGLDQAVRELLQEWCRVVCAHYFVRVADFSESFADGRALCYLLHYYHPMLLTKREIQLTTTEYASSERAIRSERDIVKALENEQRHFHLVNDRVKQLGEVPVLLPEQYDSTNPPDEKVIVTFVCYLQSRLMDSSREIHAAARLKRWWRSPRVRLLMRRKTNRAAKTIQRMWYSSSVKRLAIRRCRRLLRAGRMIAGYMSAWFDRSRFLRLRRAVVSLQRLFRRARTHAFADSSKVEAASTLQRAWRCHALRQQVTTSISLRTVCKRIKTQMSARRIQSLLRLNVAQKREQREAVRRYQEMLDLQRFEAGKKVLHKKVQTRCARTLQSFARAIIGRRLRLAAATALQATWRCHAARRRFLRQRSAARRVQFAVRLWIKRRQQAALERFRQLLAAQDRERRSQLLRAKVERRSACRLQLAWRTFAVNKRVAAATKIQSLVRSICCQKLLYGLKNERDIRATVCIQKHARRWIARHRYMALRAAVVKFQAFARGAHSRSHVLCFVQFRRRATVMRVKMAKWKVQQWTRSLVLHRQTQRAAVTLIQKTWKMHACSQRMARWRAAAVKIQALVVGVQSRQTKFHFASFRAKMVRTQLLMAAWTIAHWCKKRVVSYHQKRSTAAVAIQSCVRMWSSRRAFQWKRAAAVKIQARIRGVQSREHNLNFSVFKWRACRSKARLARWRLHSWLVRCVQLRRLSRAAMAIQKTVRMRRQRTQYVTSRVAATKIQACFRGKLHREFVFNYASFKTTQARRHTKMARWKLQHWLLRVALSKRRRTSCAVVVQARVRSFLARQHYVAMRQAAIKIQTLVRGVQSRRFKHNHAAFKQCMARVRVLAAAWRIQLWVSARVKLHRARRSALVKAKWTQLSFGVLRRRLEAVDSIAESWAAYRLRRAMYARVQWTLTRHSATSYIQRWWRGMLLQAAAKYQLRFLRFERAQQLERQRAELAATRIQRAWRGKVRQCSAKRARQSLVKMRRFYAGVCINSAVVNFVVRVTRQQRGYLRSVRRVQSWWRGMLVRLHEKRQAVTEQRKKLATMTLVTPDHHASDKNQPQSENHVQDAAKPLTLGARLEMALHMLLHGKRLQEMLFASHTIELCTRYSRECAWKCVQLKISHTIFAAIRGLNRSRPHVELLHQLLLVLANLTSYQRKESKNYTLPSILESSERSPVDHDDLRAVDALVDLIHVHRDMHVVFVLASRVLKHYLLVLKPHTAASKEVFNQWSEAYRRLRALHELLVKKMQVAAWTSKVAAAASTPSKAATPNASHSNANVLAKINPKTAVAVVAQLLKVIE